MAVPKYPYQVSVEAFNGTGGIHKQSKAFETIGAAWQYGLSIRGKLRTRRVTVTLTLDDWTVSEGVERD